MGPEMHSEVGVDDDIHDGPRLGVELALVLKGGPGEHDSVGHLRVCIVRARVCVCVCVRACGWVRVCLRYIGMFVCMWCMLMGSEKGR